MREIKEEWKLINNCDDYAISNLGEVKSAKRLKAEEKHDFSKWKTLKPRYRTPFYKSVTIYDNDGCQHQWTIHRLVAIHFIPNPDNLPMVNHKDENGHNNRVDNLEWCNNKYNSNYGHSSRKIYSYTDKLLFYSISACAEYYNVSKASVCKYLDGLDLPKKLKNIQLQECKLQEYDTKGDI